MDDATKKVHLQKAQDILSNKVLEAMKEIAKETGARAVDVQLQLIFDTKAGLGAGGAAILLVYPDDIHRAAGREVDPEAAKNLVADLLAKLKTKRN